MVVDPRKLTRAFESLSGSKALSTGNWERILEPDPSRISIIISEADGTDYLQVRFQDGEPSGSDSGLYVLSRVEHFTFAGDGGLTQRGLWARANTPPVTISWVETRFYPDRA